MNVEGLRRLRGPADVLLAARRVDGVDVDGVDVALLAADGARGAVRPRPES